MAQDDQKKRGSILHQEEFYLPLKFSSPYALLFSTVKEVYYSLGLKNKNLLAKKAYQNNHLFISK